MMDKDNGGPAFPVNDERLPSYEGMTLRDYFAAQAITGLIMKAGGEAEGLEEMGKLIATLSYAVADGMMEARK